MTDALIKTEDYREISEYWCHRLFNVMGSKLTIEQACRFIKNHQYYGFSNINDLLTHYNLQPIFFNYNVMTLGYPKKGDSERIIKYEHKGVEIGYGKTEWGAEEGKLYFIIKHGKKIQDAT